ncbi:hypothetical protein ACRN98_23580 [Shewanella oncorhynchi]|uniref:hypothetical protein n=1 Tax=Shewanella oncorhynchi TaxID=2726434 RepID=UPI003D7A67AA
MKRNVSLTLLVVLLTSCSQRPPINYQPQAPYMTQVKYETSPIGADIYELETGKYLGISPLVVSYNLTNAKLFDGCRLIKGVSATWKSGTSNTPFAANKLCGFDQVYTITIPYIGDEKQREHDVEMEPIFIAALQVRDAQQPVQPQQQMRPQQQGISDGEAIIWSSVISSVGMLTGILTAPIIMPPTPQAPNATEYYQQNYQQPAYQQQVQTTKVTPIPVPQTSPSTLLTTASGCTSDYECGLGLSCIKGPLQSTGQCMQKVNEYGTPLPTISNPSSGLPNTNINGQCTLNSECPIGFRCDMTLKNCVK